MGVSISDYSVVSLRAVKSALDHAKTQIGQGDDPVECLDRAWNSLKLDSYADYWPDA